MNADNDLIKLYSGKILAHASDIPHLGHLDNPDATARRRSPLCGSTVSVDLSVLDGRISAFAQDVKACALGQAAASVIGHKIIGLSKADVQRGRDELCAMLKDGADAPAAPFSGLEILSPARDFKNRHASILLTFDAILEAFELLNAQ